MSKPIARIGSPCGLPLKAWQLKELAENNKVGYYEIFRNELMLYFRKIEENEINTITIDFKAIFAESYKRTASQADLTYKKEYKN